MTRKKVLTGPAEGRKLIRRMITAFSAFGADVHPWKRAMVWVFVVIDAICLGIIVALDPPHLPLLLLCPVGAMMCAYEYLTDTRPLGRAK